jgi:hypothetical protein
MRQSPVPRPRKDESEKRVRYNFTADPSVKPRLEAVVAKLAHMGVTESRLIEACILRALPDFEADAIGAFSEVRA